MLPTTVSLIRRNTQNWLLIFVRHEHTRNKWISPGFSSRRPKVRHGVNTPVEITQFWIACTARRIDLTCNNPSSGSGSRVFLCLDTVLPFNWIFIIRFHRYFPPVSTNNVTYLFLFLRGVIEILICVTILSHICFNLFVFVFRFSTWRS